MKFILTKKLVIDLIDLVKLEDNNVKLVKLKIYTCSEHFAVAVEVLILVKRFGCVAAGIQTPNLLHGSRTV